MTNYKKALPECEGPKLPPFRNLKTRITFNRLIRDSQNEGHAYVFEVSINAQVYALKVFKFYNDEEDLRGLTGDDLRHVSIDLLHAHMDPFFNECRSYGKLIEKNLNGKVAVHCYGYITLPAKREDELKSRFNIEEWDRPGNHYTLPHSRRPPLRAIVKQLIREEVPLTQKSAAKMLRDLKSMRRAGVYPIDVHERNYKGGLLVDMSIAMVKPHFLFDIRPPWQVADMYKSDDLRNFQTMIDNAGINSTLRTMPNREYKKKLRSYRAP